MAAQNAGKGIDSAGRCFAALDQNIVRVTSVVPC